MLFEDHFEVLVALSCERWRHVMVPLLNLALLKCWSQCSPRRLHGWTRCPCSMTQCHDFLQEQIVLSLCVCAWAAWLHRLPCSTVSMLNTNVFRQSLRFHRSIWRTKFLVQTLFIDLVGTGRFTFIQKNMFFFLKFPRSITDWFGLGLGWFGEFNTLNFSKRLLNKFIDWLLFNCRSQLIIPFSPIVIVFQWDLWWWSRRQRSSLIQHFSSLQLSTFGKP